MGLFDSIKNIMNIPEEDEFEEEVEEVEEAPKRKQTFESAPPKRETQPRILGGNKSKTVNFNANQMMVILVKPDRFEDVTSIADHLNNGKTVVLNLEACERDVSRRIIDFLSGVAYAQEGKIKKVAVNTYLITPYNVDLMGDLIDELENNGMFF